MGRSNVSSDVQALLNKPEPYTPGEVAAMFGVHPKTISRWASNGKLTSFRTVGGHRRFPCQATRESLTAAKAGRWR